MQLFGTMQYLFGNIWYRGILYVMIDVVIDISDIKRIAQCVNWEENK